MPNLLRTDRGFSLTELMLTVAVIATIAGMAVPVLMDASDSIKLNEAARIVERELQDARLKAVSSNRVLRFRTNCPSTGFLRTVEVIGNATDTAPNRCIATAFPYPAGDDDLMTRPNFDGPVRKLTNEATVSNSVIQFSPDGTSMQVVGGVPTAIAAPVTVTVTRRGQTKSVTINGIGKVQLQ